MFIRDVLKCEKYDAELSPPTSPEAAEAVTHCAAFFTPTMIGRIFDVLIQTYLGFGTDEQEAWEENPEGFAVDEVGESWQYIVKVSLVV